jgi:hypothetical protein
MLGKAPFAYDWLCGVLKMLDCTGVEIRIAVEDLSTTRDQHCLLNVTTSLDTIINRSKDNSCDESSNAD